MIFPFVPFLLETLVYDKNQAQWNFGPEYVFKFNKTTAVFMNVSVSENVSATVKCRPNVSLQNVQNVLFCSAHKITFSNILRETYEHVKETGTWPPSVKTELHKIPDQFFEIEFGMRGVYSLKINKFPHDYVDIISDIVEQFNVNVNSSIMAQRAMKNYEFAINASLKKMANLFEQNEDMVKSTCNSLVRIYYELSNRTYKDGEFPKQRNKTKPLSFLRLIAHTKSVDSYISIRRHRLKCIPTLYIVFGNEKWKATRLVSPKAKEPLYDTNMVIQSKKPKFSSHTYIKGDIFLQHSNKNSSSFRQDVHLELLRIKPAKHEFRSIEYEYTLIKSET